MGRDVLYLGVFLCLLLAHFLADFPLQSRKIIQFRNTNRFIQCLKGTGIHIAVHLAVSFVCTVYFWSFRLILIILFVTIFHGFIDIIKARYSAKHPYVKNSVFLFLGDQAVHLLMLFVSVFLSGYTPNHSPIQIWMNELFITIKDSVTSVTYQQKILLSIILFIAGIWGVGISIKICLERMAYRQLSSVNEKLNKPKIDGAHDGGYTIGLLERTFIIVSILLDLPLVIGFILTAKSVARLKKFSDDRFAEIFIIGSLMSFLSATVIGYLVKFLLVR